MLTIEDESAKLLIDHMNQNKYIELEFMVSKYRPGNFNVDMAKSGVELRRVDYSQWDRTTGIINFLVRRYILSFPFSDEDSERIYKRFVNRNRRTPPA
jgi:hypothetical protein